MNTNPEPERRTGTRHLEPGTRNWFAATLLTALIAIAIASGEARQAGPTAGADAPMALVGGLLIDGSGGPPIRDSVVLVRGERIERVGTVSTLPVPGGYTTVSTDGMTVLPGLWDPHVHLLYSGHPNLASWFRFAAAFEGVTIPAAARQMLMAGVTSVRDLGAPVDAILAVRQRIARGELPGPTIYTAGVVLMNGAAPAMTHAWSVGDPADAAAKVRTLADAGVDLIKVANAEQMPLASFRAIVAEAHARGLRVTAHGRTDAEIRLGLQAGVDEFQHIGTGSPEYPADLVASLRERVGAGPPLSWSPTIGAQMTDVPTYVEMLEDPSAFVGLTPDMEADIRRAIAAYTPPPATVDVRAIVRRKVAQLREAGVSLVFGSDIGGFGANTTNGTWQELDVWVRELGIEPLRALRYATADAAASMGQEQAVGTVTAGKRADIIAVRGDPRRSMTVLREPAIVIRSGTRHR